MKKLTSFIFTILILNTFFAQNNGHSFSISASNNGHVAPLLQEFYIDGSLFDFSIRAEDYTHKKSDFKGQVDYLFSLEEKFNLGLSIGYGYRKMNYENLNPTVNVSGEGKQDYYSIMPSITKSFKMNSIEFSTGIGVPITFVQNFTQEHLHHSSSSQELTSLNAQGGFCVGLSSISSIKWRFTKSFYINTQFHVGYQYAQMGGDWVYDNSSTIIKTYSSSSISRPEVLLGIGYTVK
jgi:hypothetical protein